MSTPPPPGASTVLALLVVLALCTALAAYLARRTLREWPVIGLIAAVCFGFGLAYDRFLPDDSYITYRYAHNLLAGHGLVFNPGEYVLSTTTPLYALLLAGAGIGWPDLPVTSHILSMPALFGGAWGLYMLLARHGKAVAGLALAVLYILNPFTAAVYSSESILHVALIVGALLAYDADRLEWAAVCGALAVLNRGDGALVAGALGLHWLLTGRWRGVPLGRVARVLAIYAAISLPWYAFSWAYYGTLAPATMAAKMAQGQLPNAPLFGPGLGTWWMSYAAQSPFYWLIPPLALLGLLLTFPRGGDRWAWPALLWAALYAAGYTLLGVTRYQNYYTPLAPIVLLLAVLGAHWLGAALDERAAGRKQRAILRTQYSTFILYPLVVLGLGLGIGAACWATGSNLYPRLPQARAVVYEEAGRWIAAHTSPSSSIGMYEVGTVGYYAERRIIDFYGLIQPDVAAHLAAPTWAPRHYAPDYIFIHPDWYLPVWQRVDPTFDAWWTAQYAPVHTFRYERCDCNPMVLYARK